MENEMKYQRATELFEQNEYEAAVELLIELYETGYQQELIIQNLYDCFITPNEKEFQGNYEKNRESLCDDDYDSLLLDFIPVSDTKYYIFHKQLCRFLGNIDLSDDAAEEREADIHSILIADTWDFREMVPHISSKRWNTVYILLNEHEGEFLSFLKLPEIEEKYLSNALIFRSLEMMEQFFLCYPQYYIPKEIVSENTVDYADMMLKLHRKRLNMQNGKENVFLSICIPSYGRGSVCLENVQNLLQLVYDSEIEIVVSNNGSTEDIEGYDVIKNLKDSRITYFAFEENQGYGANVCKMLELAKGQFIVFASDEDFMYIENLHDYLNFLLNHSASGILYASGTGSNFPESFEGSFPAGIPAAMRALEMRYLTGITLNRYWVKNNRVLERIADAGDNTFVKIYMHCALAALTAEHTFISISPVVLWTTLDEKESVEEKGEEILSYMHYESRIEQLNSVIEFIENVMQVSADEWYSLVEPQIEETYWLCKQAYIDRTLAYKKLIDWRTLCQRLHENNLRLLERWRERLSKSEIKKCLQFMEELFFENTSKINPMQSVLTMQEQLDYLVVAGMAKDLFQMGRLIEKIDYPELERNWKNEVKSCAEMKDELGLYLHKALSFEQKGAVDDALEMLQKCRWVFPEQKREVELEIARMNYRNGREENALRQFVSIYQETGDEPLLECIIELYDTPKRRGMQERYQKNISLLKDYLYFYGTAETLEPRYCPLWMGEQQLWYYDSKEKSLNQYSRMEVHMTEPEDTVCLGYNILWEEDIACLERNTRKVNPFMDEENPLLLVYQPQFWELLLQLLDLQQLLELDRVLFYNSLEQMKISLMEDARKFPKILYGRGMEEVWKVLVDVSNELNRQFEENRKRAQVYYKNNEESIIRRIKEGTPRILFETSRFTTALQYHIRDCKNVAEHMGLQTELNIEPDRLGRIGLNIYSVMKVIADFLPDIIFEIDHLRSESLDWFEGMDAVVWVCWVQDDMPFIFDKETPKKQKNRDIIINAHFSWDRFFELGYNEKRLINYPMVANPEIYRPYQLSETELDKYACDVCLVCHKPASVTYAKQVAERYCGSAKDFVMDVLYSYIDYAKDTEQIFMKEEEYRLFVGEFAKKFYNAELTPDFEEEIAHEMAYSLKNILYRERLADWLIDAGYTNLKLWGNGWADTKKYRPYAMGPAENGEVLAKINQAAKIVIGNNGSSTGAARVAETFLSGGFYINPVLPDGTDTNNIRMFLKEDEDFICFREKEDFLEKIEFYLTHEEERNMMREAGRKKTMELLTYQMFMKNVLKKIGDMF